MNHNTSLNSLGSSDLDKSRTFSSFSQQKVYDAYQSLKNNDGLYWQIMEGLQNEQKIEIFLRILKKEIPESRSEYQLQFLQQQCKQFEFFKNISNNYGDDVVKTCVRYLRYEDRAADQIVFEQGERGTRFYIILQGSVHILIRLPEKGNVNKFKQQKINTIHAGKAFGEVALMNDNTTRTATIKAAEFCRFAYLEKEDFKSIIGSKAVEQINQRYNFIKDYSFFDEFAYREIITFSYHFNEMNFKRGEIVYDIFDSKIDDIYFVKEGSFMLQGSFDITQQIVPNFKQKRQHKTFNIDFLVEKSIFGLEYFNKQILKDTHFYIKYIEEMSSSAPQSQHGKLNISNLNQQQVEGQNQAPYQPSRIARVICDSTRGTLYRVKGSEIEQRLWKQDSKEKWNSLSKVIFEKQVKKIKEFIEKSLQEKSDQELQREQVKYLKPPIEYLGKTEEIRQFYSSESPTQRNSLANVQSKSPNKHIDHAQSPLLKNSSGSLLNNHISLLLDLDKFMKSSIDIGLDKSPFSQSIQKMRNIQNSPSLSPSKYKNNIQNCINSLRWIDGSPKKSKNVTISEFGDQQNLEKASPKRNCYQGNASTTNRNHQNINKNFTLSIFQIEESGSSQILDKKIDKSSHIIKEEDDFFNKMYGSSLLLNKKNSPRRQQIKKTNSAYSFNSHENLDSAQRTLENLVYDDEDEDIKSKKEKKKKMKQCSPPKKSPEKEALQQEKDLIKSEKKFKKDFIKKLENIQKKEKNIQLQNQNSTQKNQTKDNKVIKTENPSETLNKLFYFSHKRNLMVKRQEEVKQFKNKFLGEDPEESNPSQVIRGDNAKQNVQDQDLLQATTLDDYKRRKFQRKLEEEQIDKFQKLFSNDLVELSNINEDSEYNQKVKQLYIDNSKVDKIIFDQTAHIVKQQNCSYNQVREYFYKLNHKDRFFQDLYLKKAKQEIANNLKNTSQMNTDSRQISDKKSTEIELSQASYILSNSRQSYATPKKPSISSVTPNRRRTLTLKEKRASSSLNGQLNGLVNETNVNISNDLDNDNLKYHSDQRQNLSASNQENIYNEYIENINQDEEEGNRNKKLIQLIKNNPSYLFYLQQKNYSECNRIFEQLLSYSQEMNQSPLKVQKLDMQNEQEYYLLQALKIHQELQNKQLTENTKQETQAENMTDENYSGQIVTQISYNCKTEGDNKYNYRNQNADERYIESLKQTEGTPRLSQNHLSHLKYTPKYNKNQKNNRFSPFNNFSFDAESLTQHTFNKSHSQMNNKSTLETHTLKKIILNPNDLLSNQKTHSSSFVIQKSPNTLPQQLSVQFNNSIFKQDIDTSTKNTFLSQNHRKQIIDNKIKNRELFLRSKSSLKRYSFASTNNTESKQKNKLQVQQLEVNSKCLTQIPGWSIRANTSNGVRQKNKFPNRQKANPRSLQIVSSVSPIKYNTEQRIQTSISFYQSTPNQQKDNFLNGNSSFCYSHEKNI
ncbi:cyclic nucleotide-binding domain protein (macronuclear) [Tetrahymena thermophila SB210]|uniref:Cyclic nucleotide-binding domain protein n=1 Tax=Tetrahymena thermophila (strain SB210) TaxID=312017 RepID=I7LTW4_TETTS|nr:cyclic nucleotide-binding domain protein [Tetrahymena thermophila SB210]EAR87410.2 cyclic nucleotide-binding domain protein [Tetrahymena thermophila SB210]|eukprot:XP_001007655.2 cyclic nucleotide-binding domain protein [Tetrahymena thermophila SB210]